MSGFKRKHVRSILETNNILQKEGAGLIFTNANAEASDLYEELISEGFIVADKKVKPVLKFDYIVIPAGWNWENLIYSFSVLSVGGIMVLEVNDVVWAKKYVSEFAGFTATRVKYGDTFYLVIHNGVDYGN